jgi:hypothetical protein
MNEQELDRMLPGWRSRSDAVGRELIAWREAHPKASLSQIEDAVFEPMQRVLAYGSWQSTEGGRGAAYSTRARGGTIGRERPAGGWPRATSRGRSRLVL